MPQNRYTTNTLLLNDEQFCAEVQVPNWREVPGLWSGILETAEDPEWMPGVEVFSKDPVFTLYRASIQMARMTEKPSHFQAVYDMGRIACCFEIPFAFVRRASVDDSKMQGDDVPEDFAIKWCTCEVSASEFSEDWGTSRQYVYDKAADFPKQRLIKRKNRTFAVLLNYDADEVDSLSAFGRDLGIPHQTISETLKEYGLRDKHQPFWRQVDSDDLFQKYVVEGMSLAEVAECYDSISRRSVKTALNKHGIPIRPAKAEVDEKTYYKAIESWKREACKSQDAVSYREIAGRFA